MYNIGEFFKKIQNKQAASFFVQNTVSEVLKEVANIDVLPKDVEVSKSKIVLKGISQVIKSELFIKKKLILEEINKRQNKNITEIR